MLDITALKDCLATDKERVAVELARYGEVTGDQRMTCQGTHTRLTTYAHLGYRWTVCKVNGKVDRVDKRVS